jgi:hypothetical protein
VWVASGREEAKLCVEMRIHGDCLGPAGGHISLHVVCVQTRDVWLVRKLGSVGRRTEVTLVRTGYKLLHWSSHTVSIIGALVLCR